MSYHANAIKIAEENENFRRVISTGEKSQLVVMSVPPGGDVGEETHEHVEQTLLFVSGSGKAKLNDDSYEVSAGDVVRVTPGVRHNFINTGTEPLKIFTVYAPPNHIDGRVHATKEDAEKDVEDEEFGHQVA
ncbi:cupin domain-containing protein [Candidatus Parcubacteria bacterium]|nr:cupin domain-containing protein [Candidatus Parcubacteria bacterium]